MEPAAVTSLERCSACLRPGCFAQRRRYRQRRSFASQAVECGVDPYTLKFLLNHSAESGSDVTQRYIRPSFEHLKAAAEKIAARIIGIGGNDGSEPAEPKPLEWQGVKGLSGVQ
jgi:hypothetical protein